MLTDCKPISPRPFLVAESPIWDDRRNCAFFVDIKGHALLSWDPQSRLMQEWPMGEDIGFVALTDSAELIVGRKSGLALFNPDKNEYRPFTGFRPAPNERLNDGKVDREGNLFFGTMHDQAAPECGVLYRLTPDLGFTKVATGYGVPNGPAFASDGVFFHCATDQGRIDLHHPDGVGWASETFMQLSKEDGLPDGILLDDEGSLWCGLWGGGGLLIMDPSTKSTQKLHVPATYITSMSPIGTDNHTLLITSAAGPVLRGERGGAPLEGRVFQAKLTRPWRVQSLRFGTPDL